MGIAIEIDACGPLRGAELELPERGIVAIIGPNLSGKSLVEAAISSAAFATTVVKDGRLIDSLAKRLVDEDWGELYSLIDPMDYLTAEVEYKDPEDHLKTIDEIIRRSSDDLLGVREYLIRTALVTDVCASKGVGCWTGNHLPTPMNIELRVNHKTIRARIPPPDPGVVGIKEFSSSIWVEGFTEIVGVNMGSPNEFLKRIVARGKGPSSELARIILEKYQPDLSPDVLREILGALISSWKEISSYDIDENELSFVKWKGEPAIMIGGEIFPWRMTSDGMINLLAHYYIARLLPILGREGKVIVGLEEPEAHLDPYVTYKLPEVYGRLARIHGAILIFSTHSETLIKGIEGAMRRGTLGREEVRIYETVYNKERRAFSLKECPISEEGIIEGSRFTEIAWKIIEEGA